MFKSEPQSLEDTTPKEQSPTQEQQPVQQQARIPEDSQRVLNILGTEDLSRFTMEYIGLLRRDSDNLTGFLNELFGTTDSNIFEFLFNLFKANSDKEWSIVSFYTTIMNLGLAIKDKGSPSVYHYLFLTTKEVPSPLYGLAQELTTNRPPEEINDHFINTWNGIFGNKTKKSKKGKESFEDENSFSKTFNVKFLNNMSKQTRYSIILTIVLLVVILLVCGGYFVNKYGKNMKSISIPKPQAIKINTGPVNPIVF